MKQSVFSFLVSKRDDPKNINTDIINSLDEQYPRIELPMSYYQFTDALNQMVDDFELTTDDWVYNQNIGDHNCIVIWTTTEEQAIELKLRITP